MARGLCKTATDLWHIRPISLKCQLGEQNWGGAVEIRGTLTKYEIGSAAPFLLSEQESTMTCGYWFGSNSLEISPVVMGIQHGRDFGTHTKYRNLALKNTADSR